MGGSEEIATQVAEPEDEERTELAICLVSGGMDSCVTAALAHEPERIALREIGETFILPA